MYSALYTHLPIDDEIYHRLLDWISIFLAPWLFLTVRQKSIIYVTVNT